MKKSALMGTLAALALGVSATSPAEARVEALCSWIDQLPGRTPAEANHSISELNKVLAKLRATGRECVLGPGGEKFCEPCIARAAARICDLAAAAAGPEFCKEPVALT